MRRFILLVLIFWLISALVTGAVIIAARQEPIPARITTLHLTDCLPPCWIGIVPGKTTIGEARAAILQTFAPSADYEVRLTSSADYAIDGSLYGKADSAVPLTIQFSVLAYQDQGDDSVVNEIEMLFPPRFSVESPIMTPTLADFHRLLGAPSRRIALSAATNDSLNYGDDSEGVNLSTGLNSWDEPVSQVFFYRFTNPFQRLTYALAAVWNGMSPEHRTWVPCRLMVTGTC